MPKLARELTALHISRLSEAGHHCVGGVKGMYLYITPSGAKSWVLRTMVGSKRRHIGLGAYPTVTLALARDKARQAHQQIQDGIDPIARKKQAQVQLKAKQTNLVDFETATLTYIDMHGDTWRNPKHRAQWESTLRTYAFPVMGKLPVGEIQQEHVLQILEPIWKTKTETASRLRGRIENVLDWATTRKYRTGDNPARWRGHMDKLLAPPKKIQKVQHQRSLAVDELPSFIRDLAQRNGQSPKALMFAILCASRSGEVRGATWDELDLKRGVWTIPAERMKSQKDHRVPLSSQALKLLNAQPRISDSPYVFPSPLAKMLSDMALLKVTRDMEIDAVPHGFRSTFRDWVAERTEYPRELAEQALAHTLESKVEAAYLRSDLLERRRPLMQDWADFASSNSVSTKVKN